MPAADAPFGVLLRDLRERAGLTQEELALRASLTPHGVSALERGVRTRPYPHTVRSLADALGLDADARTALIAAVRRRGAASGARGGSAPSDGEPGGRSEPPVPTSVTVPLTALHGRDRDVAALRQVLASGSARLVTLTGPGGVGKTRLAVAVLDAAADDRGGEAFAVGLANLTDATQVLPALARAVGLRADGDVVAAVADHLAGRGAVLLLDNAEHVLAVAPDVARLVAQCPDLVALVTSRSPLRVRGEHEYPVAPLEVPDPDEHDLARLAASPAGALLLERARAVAPDLPLEPDDVAALAETCRRLAGLPLALELAAARARLLDPRTLLRRLDEAPASPARDLPSRHQTMRATLDWSYHLLDEPSQATFRLLGVFHGGATLEALEAVGARALPPGTDVVGTLEALVEQSLVLVRPGSDGRRRFTMLEPVAQYARSILDGEERHAAVAAHTGYVLDLAERAADGYMLGDQVAWLARMEAEEANVGAAFERAVAAGDGVTAGRLTWAMWLFWWLRGQLEEGLRWALLALELPAPPRVRAYASLTAAAMTFAADRHDESAAHWARAGRYAEENDDVDVRAHASAGDGLVRLSAGDLAAAEASFRAAADLPTSGSLVTRWLRGLCHAWLGTTLLLGGDRRGASDAARTGLASANARGDRLAAYVALFTLAQAAIGDGDHGTARVHLDEGIRLSGETRDLANLAFFLEALAVVESASGRHDRVGLLMGAAESLRDEVGARVYGYYQPDEALIRGAVEAARSALGEDAYEDAADAGRSLDPAGAVRVALG